MLLTEITSTSIKGISVHVMKGYCENRELYIFITNTSEVIAVTEFKNECGEVFNIDSVIGKNLHEYKDIEEREIKSCIRRYFNKQCRNYKTPKKYLFKKASLDMLDINISIDSILFKL